MPHYHFNVHDSLGLVEDEEGRELADLAVARGEALRGIRPPGSVAMRGCINLDGRLDILDGAGRLLLAIGFAEALDGTEDLAAPRHDAT